MRYDQGVKNSTSFRLGNEAKQLLALIADKLDISQAAVLEIAIRDMAKKEEITSKQVPKSTLALKVPKFTKVPKGEKK